ncbi:hypothetical protein N9948_01690 [bacterium]|nr:hypothetical protein [bacterium]
MTELEKTRQTLAIVLSMNGTDPLLIETVLSGEHVAVKEGTYVPSKNICQQIKDLNLNRLEIGNGYNNAWALDQRVPNSKHFITED